MKANKIIALTLSASALALGVFSTSELLAGGFEKLFSKIHLPKIKWFSKDNKPKQVTRRNSSEPEETIFIGIND